MSTSHTTFPTVDRGSDEPAAVGDRRGNVAIIRLNRPTALNSVNSALSSAVGELLEAAAVDDEMRAVVLTGTGDRQGYRVEGRSFGVHHQVPRHEHPA